MINLYGGNDGLNCVVPHGDDRYYRLRPVWRSIAARAGDRRRASASIPAMRSLKALYDKGMVAIVQGVGYPNPDHSHFRSTEIWQTAAPERYEHTGWLGRYFDEAGLPRENLFKGVAVSKVLPEVLVSDRTDIPAIPGLGAYSMMADRDAARAPSASRVRRATAAFPSSSPYLAHVMEIEGDAQRSSEELPRLVAGYKTKAAYPATGLGRSLALAAQIVGSNLGTKAIYVEHGSFDTHVSQKKTQNAAPDAVLERHRAPSTTILAAHGNDRRVLDRSPSASSGGESRRTASRGTDHGEASPLFLIGGGVSGGLYGAAPDLGATNMGNVRYTVDFRSVYATVLERWLGRPSAGVLNGEFRAASGSRASLASSILFLGSGGARFVVARQLRASGGMWMRFGETQIHVDPGPGRAGARALARAAVQSARARRDRALAQASRSLGRRQRADRGDDLRRIPPPRRAARARRRVRR